MKSPVVFINPFSVPKGIEDEFLKFWDDFARVMKNEPGFIDTKLHRSLDPDARFQFINVALWESPEVLQAAWSKPEIQKLMGLLPQPIESNPAVYMVEVQY